MKMAFATPVSDLIPHKAIREVHMASLAYSYARDGISPQLLVGLLQTTMKTGNHAIPRDRRGLEGGLHESGGTCGSAR